MDSATGSLGDYMMAGAYIIPVSPLAGGTKYTGSVTFDVGGTPVSKTWSFTTATGKPLSVRPSFPAKVKGSSTVSGTATCSGPCKLTVTLTASGFKKALVTKSYTLTSTGTVKVKLTLPKSARSKVKKAKITISAKDLAPGATSRSTTKSVTFSR